MKHIILFFLMLNTSQSFAHAQTCDAKPTEPAGCAQARAILKTIPAVKQPVRAAPAVNPDSSQQMMNTVISPIIIITGNQAPASPQSQEQVKPAVPVVEASREPRVRIVKEYVRVSRPRKKNTVSFLAGSGPGKIFTTISNEGSQVNTKQSVIFGTQFQRHFDNDMSIGITVLSNTSALVGVGVDF